MIAGIFAAVVAQLILLPVSMAAPQPSENTKNMILVPAGRYVPFIASGGDKLKAKSESKQQKQVEVARFWMDRFPITNQDFLGFLKNYPEWRKSRIKPIFTDLHYLEDWKSDLKFASKAKMSPVTHVSWFVAQAYCESTGKELPTTDQWEYALADQGRDQIELKEKILSWYGKPHVKMTPVVGSGGKNGYAIYDLAGLIWEWTLDFNSPLGGQDSNSGGKDSDLFCGSGSQIATDSADYASFMRYSFRSSLRASYTTGDLGFRCVRSDL